MLLEAFVELAGGLDHPEGVTLGPDGLVYAGGEAGQIYRIEADDSVTELASTGGFLYGVVLDADPNVYACDFGNASVARITSPGEVSTYSSGTADRPMRVPNFAAFDDEGNLYVTDSGEWGSDDGLIYRIAPDGATTVWTDELNRFPNGCCLSAHGGSLYVVESRGRAISQIAIADDGSAGPVEQITDLTGSQPDGIALWLPGTSGSGSQSSVDACETNTPGCDSIFILLYSSESSREERDGEQRYRRREPSERALGRRAERTGVEWFDRAVGELELAPDVTDGASESADRGR